MTYADRVKHCFIANEITEEDKQCSGFISTCCPATYMYKCISTLMDVEKLKTINSEKVVDELKLLYDHKPSSIVQLFKFYSCVHGQVNP